MDSEIQQANINYRICDMLKDVSAITKAQTNTHQGFKFRGIDQVYNEIHPLLAKHRVFIAAEAIDSNVEQCKTAGGKPAHHAVLTVHYKAYAADGSSVSMVGIGEAMDTGDKACSKALSMAYKYAIFQLLCIPTEEFDDADSYCPQVGEVGPTNDEIDKLICGDDAGGGRKAKCMRMMKNTYSTGVDDGELNETGYAWIADHYADFKKWMASL